MNDKFSYSELADIFKGEVVSMDDFIKTNMETRPPRPQHWKEQMLRIRQARFQAYQDYSNAAKRQKDKTSK